MEQQPVVGAQVFPNANSPKPALVAKTHGAFAVAVAAGLVVLVFTPIIPEVVKHVLKALFRDQPGSTSPIAHKTVRGDSLTGLSATYYQSENNWVLIWDFNYSVIGPNPNCVSVGAFLQIPPLSSFTAEQLDAAFQRRASWRQTWHKGRVCAPTDR